MVIQQPWQLAYSMRASEPLQIANGYGRNGPDLGAMHMSGCNYQKDFSFCSWQRTLFIFVIGTLAFITGPKPYQPLEVGRGTQTRATNYDMKNQYSCRLNGVFTASFHQPNLWWPTTNWLDLLICVKFVSSPEDRNNLIPDLDGLWQFFFMLKVRKTHKKSIPK